MTYLYLFLEFFKVGLFSVGGGLATIPFLKQIAEKGAGRRNSAGTAQIFQTAHRTTLIDLQTNRLNISRRFFRRLTGISHLGRS
jgi:hypothetical protein